MKMAKRIAYLENFGSYERDDLTSLEEFNKPIAETVI